MNQFFEKIQNANPFQKNSLKAEPKISKHPSRKIDQLIIDVTQLIDDLSHGPFKSLEIGREALDDFRDVLMNLESTRDDGSYIDPHVLVQAVQSLKSIEVVQKVNVVSDIRKLKDQLEQAKGYGYDKQIDQVLLKLKKLDNNAVEMDFREFCSRYARYHQFAEKILIKTFDSKEATKLSEKTKVSIHPKSRQEIEAFETRRKEQDEVKRGLVDLRGSITILIKYIREINFADLKVGVDILAVLQGQLDSLSDDHIDLDVFNKHALEMAEKNFEVFIEGQRLELKEDIQGWYNQLDRLSKRLFCVDRIKGLQGDMQKTLDREPMGLITGFYILCEDYGNFDRSFNDLNTSISEEARTEYQELIRSRDLLNLGEKIDEVEQSLFLSESEKQDFKDSIQHLRLDLNTLGLDNIRKGDAEAIVAYRNPAENYSKLVVGKDSIAFKRERLCQTFQNRVRHEVSFLQDDTSEQWIECIRQSLLTNRKDGLEGFSNRDAETDPHVYLLKTLQDINCQMENLKVTFDAYKIFVNESPLNFRHTKNGINHAEDVVETAINRMSSFLNQEVGDLLERASTQGGNILEQDLVAFNESLVDVKKRWEKETLVHSSEKSGFNRHSFNNYLRFWMKESGKVKSRWLPTVINVTIANRYQNMLEIFAGNPLGFFFGGCDKAPYNMDNLRIQIEGTKEELREMDGADMGLGI